MGAYSQSSEPVVFERDCAAIMVPQGQEVTLPAGQNGYITQALGGSFTVFVDGNLFRIAGIDADAIGKEPPPAIVVDDQSSDADVEKLVWEQLRTCFDPEIPVNIVDLGLIYERFETTEDGKQDVTVDMTLTAQGCPAHVQIGEQVKSRLEQLPGIRNAHVNVVWTPPWTPERLSADARKQLGIE